jgi:phenylacetate-CoA ligase
MFKKAVSYGLQHYLREGWLCHSRVQQLLAHEQLDVRGLTTLQRDMLRRTLVLASQRIPAYLKLRVPDTADAIIPFLRESIPVVTKKDLITARQQYYPNGGIPRNWTILGKTSGTTGSPLDVFRSLNSVVWENAFVRRHWRWSGFQPSMRRATLRGEQVLGLDRITPPYWIFNRIDNQLLLSTRHLSGDTAHLFSDAIRNFKPAILQAYPSTAYLLAQALQRDDQRLTIPWVFTASEMLYPYQRALIEERIGRVMDFYGMAERVAFAGECEFGNMHVNSDYSFVEILDEDNQPTDDEGFVVGTTFHNAFMPLVRYKLSDRTRWKQGVCKCGRYYPMIEPISGKFEDLLFGSSGNAISPSIITFAFKGVANISSSQVAQTGPETWEVRVVPGPGYSDEDGARIIQNIHSSVDRGLTVTLVLRETIQRTSAGKYRWVVNEWKTNQRLRV